MDSSWSQKICVRMSSHIYGIWAPLAQIRKISTAGGQDELIPYLANFTTFTKNYIYQVHTT